MSWKTKNPLAHGRRINFKEYCNSFLFGYQLICQFDYFIELQALTSASIGASLRYALIPALALSLNLGLSSL